MIWATPIIVYHVFHLFIYIFYISLISEGVSDLICKQLPQYFCYGYLCSYALTMSIALLRCCSVTMSHPKRFFFLR